MWTWSQSRGECADELGVVRFTGYSGHGVGRNNPAMQDAQGIGPLPRGIYQAAPPVDRPGHTGLYSIKLDPLPGTEMFGRSEFYMHGERIDGKNYGDNSEGCIIGPHLGRQAFWEECSDHLLEVVE